jgi:arsenite-transporting ATPase
VARLSFFIGKGGVGKTTVSAAYAVQVAAGSCARVLLLSTDPAHSLADIFQKKLGDRPAGIAVGSGRRLFVAQIDAEKRFRRFLDRYREAVLTLVERGTIFSRADIEPLLDATLPGMAEVAALLALHDELEAARYDELVVDTAPLGHTLRLFEMPEHFARFLDFLDAAGGRDRLLAARFGGAKLPSEPFLAEWRGLVAKVSDALRAPESRLVLVTTPETFALNESVRARDTLQASGLAVSEVVLNRIVRAGGACRDCRQRAARARAAAPFLKKEFDRKPLRVGEDTGDPVLGVDALRAFGEHVFAAKPPRHRAAPPKSAGIRLYRAAWPRLATPLSLTVGKGGVGKTTVSAALAYHARREQPKTAVTLCSTDPAPSLDDVFRARVGPEPRPVLGDARLRALEMDSVAEFRTWTQEMKQKLADATTSDVRGVHVDLSYDREVISALLDVVPPGVDEIFAIFRILDLVERERGRVVIDMAPTGHALELLRMPDRMLRWARLLLKSLAAHRTLPLARDMAVEIADLSQRVRRLSGLLRGRKGARLWPVMLAEPLPDRETGRLLRSLRGLGTHVGALFVNRVLVREGARCGRCRRARQWQMVTLASLRKQGLRRLYVARNFPAEIAGAKGLASFTRELWQTD